jgi:hypothetical protein
LSVGCKACGVVVTDLCKTPLPPVGNNCPRCEIYISPVHYPKNPHLSWIEHRSFELQRQKGVLSSPEFGFTMKHGVQSEFSQIIGTNTRQSVFIADRLQNEFIQWLYDNRLDVFFNEPEKGVSEKALSLERINIKASRVPPISVLLWLRFLEVEWPSLDAVA